MDKRTVKAKVTTALKKGISGKAKSISSLIPKDFVAGKLYEAYVLGLVCQRLRFNEGFTLALVGSKKVRLKSSPGPINVNYPYIRVTKNGTHVGNIWTDIEFMALSASRRRKTALEPGDYHEMDIVMVDPQAQGRPRPDQVLLAVECKNTGYQKGLLRQILGVDANSACWQSRGARDSAIGLRLSCLQTRRRASSCTPPMIQFWTIPLLGRSSGLTSNMSQCRVMWFSCDLTY